MTQWAHAHDNQSTTNGVYYVNQNHPSANDANPGSEALPWFTIQHAADTLQAGDTVYVRAGTYNEMVEPANSGSAGISIVYAAYPDDTVTLDGSGLALDDWSGLFALFEVDYIAISGFRLINSDSAGILVDECEHIIIEKNYTYNTVSSGIGVWGSGHVLVDGNEVELANNDGEQENITIAISHDFEVRNNHVHHGGPGGNGGEGIDIKDGSHDGVVYGNRVHNLNRVGIYVDAWDKHTYNIEVYGNVVYDIAAMGFSLASEAGGLLENIQIYNNIAYGNKYVGLWVSDCCDDLAASHPIRHIEIINNTFYNNGWESVGWGGGIGVENDEIENMIIRNNIVSQNLYFQIGVDNTAVPLNELTVEYNLIDGYRGVEEEIRGEHYVEGVARFVDPAAADFHLLPNSPAIDAGTAAGAPGADFDGVTRPQGAGYDIGAHEFVAFDSYLFLPVAFCL
ncbi:MAG: hypothetical protein GY803_10590 [Chloroflexi bacterium]|nr:hypothetical protein [Chloroflexota bacterium]